MAGPAPTTIYVDALPKNWQTSVPLPDGATLVGSVQSSAVTKIYYNLGASSDTIAEYISRLETDGWAANSALATLQGGFATRTSGPTLLCAAAGKPAVSITSPTGPERSFSVSVSPAQLLCNGGGALGLLKGLRGPLPTLVAARDATMTGGVIPFRFGSTGAKLVSKEPLSALIEAFASQMVAAKWQRLDMTAGPRTAVASFNLTDEHGTPWESVIAIYAAPGHSDTYYCTMDTTNLNGETLSAASISAQMPDPAK